MIKRNRYYEDCRNIPMLCVYTDSDTVKGISLVDGKIGECSTRYCIVKQLTKAEAKYIAEFGPSQTVRNKYYQLAKNGWNFDPWWKKK